MKRPIPTKSALVALCTLLACHAGAQTTPAPAASSRPASQDDAIELSPFVVNTDADEGYSARDTLGGTRIRTNLRDVGSAITVLTSKFLQDTASTNIEQAFVYATDVEVNGQGGNYLGRGDGAFLTSTDINQPSNSTRIRGLDNADATRNFFLTSIPFDAYNVDRIDVQRGPNAILFGIGSPAGIYNSNLKVASFKNSNQVQNVLGSYGTARISADFNRVLLPKQLALRLDVVDDDTHYREDPAFRHSRRIYGAGKWDPAFLNRGSAHTSFTVNAEAGRIDSNTPRGSPPGDAITPYFTDAAFADPAHPGARLTYPVYPAVPTGIGGPNPWLGIAGNRVWGGIVTEYDGSDPLLNFTASVKPWPKGSGVPSPYSAGNPVRGIVDYATYRSNLPAVSDLEIAAKKLGAWKAKSLTDPRVFNFYDQLIDGDNKHEYVRFNAANAAVSQTFFDNRLGFELAYDRQSVTNGNYNLLSQDAANITIDVVKTLPDGSPNPGAGRPMVIGNGGSGGVANYATRTVEAYRAQLFGEYDFADHFGRESLLARLLGRNVFTGLFARQESNAESRRYIRWHLAQEFAPNASASVGTASKDNNLFLYLGPSVNANGNINSASDLHLGRLTSIVAPVASSSVNVYNDVTHSFQPLPLLLLNNDAASFDNREYTAASKANDIVRSRAFVWQGYWFGGNVVPMFGVRSDKDANRFVKAPQAANNAVYGLDSDLYQLPTSATQLNSRTGITDTSATSRTYSLVVHTPAFLRRHLPFGLQFSPYFNRSENVQAQPGRIDVIGTPIPNPKGTTREYGLRVSALDDRVSFRWTHFKTAATNISASSIGGSQFEIGHSEAFGQAAMHDYRDNPGRGRFSSRVYGYTSGGQAVTWRPDGPLLQNGTTYTYSQAQLDQTYAKEKASIDAWSANPVPQTFQDIWGLTNYTDAEYNAAFAANPNNPPSGVYSNNPGVTVTQDQVSKGDEFEIHATPLRGWDVFATASHINAFRDNLASSFVQWASARWQLFQGPAGDMRVSDSAPGEGNSADYPGQNGDTIRNLYKNVMANILYQQRSAGMTVPELKPWHFSGISNYSFQTGRLKGLNVGGAYRWSSGNITGTPVKLDASGNAYFDVAHPYHGRSESIVDLWIGYRWKLSGKVQWRTQLNVRNVFADDRLIVVTTEPDGSPAGYRIPEPRTFSLTNTIEF